MRVAVIGNPRSGTMYTANLFQSCGWDVGHEELRPDGISCWSWGVRRQNRYWIVPSWPETPPAIIHIVREPLPCILSIARYAAGLHRMREPFVYIPKRANFWERIVFIYLGWNLLCQAQAPTHTVKTENVHKVVADLTGSKPDLTVDRHALPHGDMTETAFYRELSPMGLDAYEQSKEFWGGAA